MALDFPATPTVGQKYPQPAIGGVPVYTWDGEKWAINVTMGKAPIYSDGSVPMVAPLTLINPPVAATDAASKGYADAVAGDNLIVNGFMDISQEFGTTAQIVAAQGAQYILDQWTAGNTTGIQCSGAYTTAFPSPDPAIPATFQYYAINPIVVGAGDWIGNHQAIEGNRWSVLGWGKPGGKSVAIGFWMHFAVAGTFSLAVLNGNGTRSYCVPFTVTPAQAGTWVYRTAVIPPCTDGTWDKGNGVGARFYFIMAAGSNYTAPSANAWHSGNYIAAPGQTNMFPGVGNGSYLTGVTAVPGTVPVPQAQCASMRKSFDDDLRDCQRYFSMRKYANGTAHILSKYPGAGTYDPYEFPVPMRVGPTMSHTSTAGWTYTNGSAQSVALGSVAAYAWDEMRGTFNAGAVDADGVCRLYQNASGATQYIKANARF